MNKIQIVINVILVAAVATLFGIVLAGKKPACAEVAVNAPTEVMPVAYLNVDSLLANYTFAQDASEKLMIAYLQKSVADAEERVTASRAYYNAVAKLYETRRRAWPTSILAFLLRFEEARFFKTSVFAASSNKVKR